MHAANALNGTTYNITAIAKSGEVESITCDSVPDFLYCFSHQWSSLYVTAIEAKPSIFGINKQEPLAKPMNSMQCSQTGISFSIDIPAIAGMQRMEFVSPLANPLNCNRIVKAYALKGQKLEQTLPAEYLAGIFITLAKDKGLVLIKDANAANAYLRQANAIILTSAIHLLSSLNTTIGLPSISLLEPVLAAQNAWREESISKGNNNATLTLLHWLDAVKEARTNKSKVEYIPEKRAKIKVITNPALRQMQGNNTLKVEMRKLLKTLTLRYAISANAEFLASLAYTVRMAEYLAHKERKAATLEIEKRFNLDKEAKELAKLLMSVQTDEIAKDISNTLTETPSAGKGFDLLAIVARKTGKGIV